MIPSLISSSNLGLCVTFFFKEHVNNLEQILLCVLLTDDLRYFVQTFRQSDLDLFVLALEQLFVDFV